MDETCSEPNGIATPTDLFILPHDSRTPLLPDDREMLASIRTVRSSSRLGLP